MKRLGLILCLFLAPGAWADWAADRDGSAGYVTVTTLATAVDEAVPFAVVYLSDMPADFWTAMDTASDTDGKTIRVSTSDGVTQLACVPIGVNTSTDTGCLIFLGTGMSASVDVDYRIYVGNASLSMPTASGGMGEQAVFASYAGVWILNSLTDRTGNGYDMTAQNSPTSGVSTAYEGITGYDFNGTSQYMVKTSGLLQNPPITIEAFFEADVNNKSFYIAGVCKASDNLSSAMFLNPEGLVSGDPIRGWYRGNGGNIIQPVSTSGFSLNTWHYAVTSRDTYTSGTGKSYIDGGNKGTSTMDWSTIFSTDRTSIGAAATTTPQGYFDGTISHVLISDSQRSDDYVATMQDNWAGTLYTAGAWTPLDSCTDGSTGWVLFQTAATTSASGSLVDWTSTSNALVDDSNYTQAALDGGGDTDSETLKLTNPAYGTTIPTGAASYTVQFRIKRVRGSGGSNEVNDLNVQFIDDTGALVGDNLAATTTDWPSLSATTADYIATGLTLDGTEFTSAAGLAISATAINAAGAVNARVFVAWIKIDWTCGDDAAAKSRGFFALTE